MNAEHRPENVLGPHAPASRFRWLLSLVAATAAAVQLWPLGRLAVVCFGGNDALANAVGACGFLGGGTAVGIAAISSKRSARTFAWTLAGAGFGMTLEGILLGGFAVGTTLTFGSLLGGAIVGGGAALLPKTEHRTGHLARNGQTVFLLFAVALLAVGVWAAHAPSLDTWRLRWRIRMHDAQIWPNEKGGWVVLFRPSAGDSNVIRAAPLIRQHGDIRAMLFPGGSITDSSLHHYRWANQLRMLNLDGTGVTDVGLRSLSAFSNLETLILARTAISSDGLIHLQQLPRLSTLDVSETRINDSGIEHLATISSLKVVMIFDCPVSSEAIKKLREINPRLIVDASE